jgi:hypothetical protein
VKLIEPFPGLQVGHRTAQAFPSLGMLRAGIVIEKSLVVKKSRRHGLVGLRWIAAQLS